MHIDINKSFDRAKSAGVITYFSLFVWESFEIQVENVLYSIIHFYHHTVESKEMALIVSSFCAKQIENEYILFIL